MTEFVGPDLALRIATETKWNFSGGFPDLFSDLYWEPTLRNELTNNFDIIETYKEALESMVKNS